MRLAAICLLAALAALPVAAVGCRKKSDAAADADRERLQGVWVPESVDTGDPDDVPPREEVESIRFQFRDNELSITRKGRVLDQFSFALDATSDPKGMTVTGRADDCGESKEPANRECLYRFEDDRLVLILNREPGPRPTEFRARSFERDPNKPRDAGAMLVRLRKTDEAPVEPVAPPPKTERPAPGTVPTRK
jgi:uncharacterized protein (TIGR03067 family)